MNGGLLPGWHVLANTLYLIYGLAEDQPIKVKAWMDWITFPYPCHDDLIGFWS